MLIEIILAVGCVLLTCFLSTRRPKNFPPGPWGIPVLGNMLQLGSVPHKGICKIGEKYGKVFSLQLGSFRVVVLNNLETIKSALKADGFEGRPNHIPIMKVVPGGVAYNTGSSWQEQRRFVIQKLKDYGMGKASIEGRIAYEAANLVDHLKQLNGRAISFRDILQVAMLNTIWSIALGKRFSLTDGEIIKFNQIAMKGSMDPPVGGVCYFLPWLTNMFPKLTGFDAVIEFSKVILEMLGDTVKENAKTYSEDGERHFADAYWKKVCETTDPESSFFKETGVKNFVCTLTNLMTAGSDTVTSSISWAILYLQLHPEKLAKLRLEIDCVIGDTAPALAYRTRMPYTEAVIGEVLRMSSASPNSVLHSTTRPMELDGYELPAGTIIMPNLYGVHHDPKIWGDPETFRPERFLDTNGKYVKHEALIPFSTGKRVCLAENLAMNELFLYLTSLVQAFDFKFDEEKHPESPTMDCKLGLVLHPQPYFVSFLPRSGNIEGVKSK